MLPEVVEADPAEPRADEQRFENALGEVIHLDRSIRLRREYQLVGHIRLALSEGRNEPVIAEPQEGTPELSAHVNPPRLSTLRRKHFARPPPVVVALHKQVTVGVLLALTKLNVSPL